MYVCMYLMKLPSAFDCAMQVGAPGLDYRIYCYAINPANNGRLVPSAFKRRVRSRMPIYEAFIYTIYQTFNRIT